MKSKLMSQASRMGFSDALTVENSLPFEELSEVYRACDLTVFPSYYEGQGLFPSNQCRQEYQSSRPIVGQSPRWWMRKWEHSLQWATMPLSLM